MYKYKKYEGISAYMINTIGVLIDLVFACVIFYSIIASVDSRANG